MNNTHFGAIYYDKHLDKKLDYTINRIFQEMSLTELETLHQLCELETTQILQSLALAVFKIPYAGDLLSGNRSNFIDYEYSIDHYGHHIQRPNEDSFLNDDKFANPKLTEKFFIKTPYVFTLKTLDKNTTKLFQQYFVIFKPMIHILTNLTTSH